MRIFPRKIILKGFGEKNKIKFLAQGDQHHDDPGHIPRALSNFIDAVKNAPEGSGALLLGDPFSFANTRSQKALRKSFTEATEDAQESMDGFVLSHSKPFVKKIGPIADRIWGCVEGNHGWLMRNGTTIDEHIAGLLNIPYSDGTLGMTISLGLPRTKKCSTVRIVAHHGVSGAQTVGGDIQAIGKHSDYFTNVHIVLEGHTHGLSCTPYPPRLMMMDGPKPTWRHFQTWIARCGSAVGSYKNPRAGYPEKRFMRPTAPGHVEFDIWLERTCEGDHDFVVPVIQGKAVPLVSGHIVGAEA